MAACAIYAVQSLKTCIYYKESRITETQFSSVVLTLAWSESVSPGSITTSHLNR